MPKTAAKLTRAELQVMEHFWEKGESSIREIQDRLGQSVELAYTTVQTLVHRLEEKGALKRTRKIGNAFLFEPSVTRTSTYRRLIDDFLDLFGGSPEPVMSHLFESGKISLEDLSRLEKASRGEAADPKPRRKK